jgi:hypothetical protein
MIRSMYSAASGMEAMQNHIDVISNNLANVNTTGFKKGRAEFQDLLYQAVRNPTVMRGGTVQQGRPVGVEIGMGTRLVATQKIFEPGSRSARPQLVHEPRGSHLAGQRRLPRERDQRSSHPGPAWPRRARHHLPGHPRGVQRGGGRGDDRPHRRAARLRDQLARHPHGRRDAARRLAAALSPGPRSPPCRPLVAFC